MCAEGTPIVVVGNKVDAKTERKVKATQLNKFVRKNKLRHIEMSVKNGLNTNEPFLHIARKLTGDYRLRFATALGTSTPPELQSSDDSDNAACTACQLVEDRPSTKQADVAKAAALPLPQSQDNDEL